MTRYSLPLLVLGLLAACAEAPPPPLTADDPANPSGAEATVSNRRNPLDVDRLTRKSRQILAQAAKQQQQWDQGGPDSGDQEGQKMQNIPAMKMPQNQSSPSPTPELHQMSDVQMPGEQSQQLPSH
jgi:hypothetical protein